MRYNFRENLRRRQLLHQNPISNCKAWTMNAISIWTIPGLFLFAFFANSASATSFTSFRVTDQISEATYVARGVIGTYEVREEPSSNRPFTYWSFSVSETYTDSKLHGTIEIRQPGGELNGVGYFVAATANFNEGEDVVLMLRETDEDAKEVIGLASGKYTVKKSESGEEYLENGLGFPLKDDKGKLAGPKYFSQLVDRVLSNDVTESDRNIRIDPVSHTGEFQAPNRPLPMVPTKIPRKPSSVATPPSTVVNDSGLSPQKTIESDANATDRNIASKTEFSGLQSVLIMLGFLLVAGISYLVLRPKE